MTDRTERIIIFWWSALVLALVFFPAAAAWLHPPAGYHFSGVVEPFDQDANSYRAWISQAASGRYFFSSLYTTESGQAWFFHPLFLLIGWLARTLSVPVLLSWYVLRGIADAALLATLYFFLKMFLAGQPLARTLAFLLITLGGGFGWLAPAGSADTLLTEATVFGVLTWPFIFAFALALMLWFFIFLCRFAERGRASAALAAGLCLAGLGLIHLYDVVTAGIVGGFYLAVLTASRRLAWTLPKFLRLLLVGFVAAPVLFYYFWLFSHDWLFNLNTQVAQFSPPALAYVYGFGLLLPLGLVGLLLRWRRLASGHGLLLLVWLAAGVGLLFAPLSFQRRLLMGLSVPVGVLAGVGVGAGWELVRPQWSAGWLQQIYFALLTCLVALALFGTSATVFAGNLGRARQPGPPAYISETSMDAYRWLSQAPQPGAVLATVAEGNYLAAYTGRSVYAGHWAQTLNLAIKTKVIQAFYADTLAPAFQKKLFAENRIQFVYYGPLERTLGADWLAGMPARFQAVFRNADVTIYRIL